MIIIDDMIVTGRKMKVSADVLKSASKNVYAAVTHPVFSDSALENLSDDNLARIIVTDSIAIPKNLN